MSTESSAATSYSIAELIAEPPHIHGFKASGEEQRWGLAADSLRILAGLLQPGWHTLETGAGVSTILFALSGARHICISPAPQEHDRIREVCAEKGVSLDDVNFVPELSEVALPRLDLPELDVVLIDGSHAFPVVFVDFQYAAEKLRVGGYLLVDDTNLWTGEVLRDFLVAESAWELVSEVPLRTAIFRKVADPGPAWNWMAQPYVVSKSALTPRKRAVKLVQDRQFGWIAQRLAKRLRR